MTAVDETEVLDNWEEVDDLQLERVWNPTIATPSIESNSNVNKVTSFPLRPISDMMTGSIGGSANSNPGVRILKRPSAGDRAAAAAADARARPLRSLEQRQQDYEAARLRILGQARCPDDTDNMTPNTQIKIDNNRLPNVNKLKDKQNEQTSTSIPPNIVSVQPRITIPPPVNGISLLRTPKGPDNSRGFNLRR